MTQQRSLLAIFAHPDDESYSVAGTLASYAAQGVDVHLICATRGEAGLISDPSLAYRDVLGAVREDELREACRAMGIHQPHILGYRDSGMAGTKDNRDPLSLNMAKPEEVTGKLVYLIRQLRPDVVVTFDHQGVYGHPDHVAICNHATKAFQVAGDPTSYPEQIRSSIGPHAPQRLFYVAIPHSSVEALSKAIPKEEDEPEDEEINPADIGTPDDAVTVVMDISPLYEAKRRAIASHRTQQRPTDFFNRLPEDVRREFFSKEHFSQALPSLEEGTRYADLFEGLGS